MDKSLAVRKEKLHYSKKTNNVVSLSNGEE